MKISSFILTINTNQDHEVYLKLLKEAFEEWYNTQIEKSIIFKVEGEGMEKIIKIKPQVGGIERAPTNGSIHIHATIVIVHNTRIWLNPPLIRDWFSAKLNLNKVHVNVRFAMNPFAYAEEYAMKSGNVIKLQEKNYNIQKVVK